MPNRFEKLIGQLGLTQQRLGTPQMQAESDEQDMNPVNIPQIDQELARSPHPVQQEALLNEKQRLQKMQMQQLQQAQQQFAPRLAQSLDIQTHTGTPLMGPADQMVKLLLMLRKQPQGIPGVNGQPVPNATPAGGPYNPMLGGVRG